jgi:hypothetical protein
MGALSVVVIAHLFVDLFQSPPVSANGTIEESWPPQTIIWSVPSIRVKMAECAVRAVGVLLLDIGVQLSPKTVAIRAKGSRKRNRRMIIKAFAWFFFYLEGRWPVKILIPGPR